MTYGAPEKSTRRICPRHEVVVLQPGGGIPAEWALVPKDESHRGFESRPAPIPASVLIEREGPARNAKKASADWDGLMMQFAHSEEVQRSRGAL